MQSFPTIKRCCSQFLQQSCGIPLRKSLKSSLEGFAKIKIRHKKSNTFTNEFNEQLKHIDPLISIRSLYAGTPWVVDETGTEPFYVFPPNGFKFLYMKDPLFSTKVISESFNTVGRYDRDLSKSVLSGFLQDALCSDRLDIGLSSDNEILIYGISHFYAIKESLIQNYKECFY